MTKIEEGNAHMRQAEKRYCQCEMTIHGKLCQQLIRFPSTSYVEPIICIFFFEIKMM